jgi:hypothetical protein
MKEFSRVNKNVNIPQTFWEEMQRKNLTQKDL